jgi:hypothetical protein
MWHACSYIALPRLPLQQIYMHINEQVTHMQVISEIWMYLLET